jgi:hypothetical protein
LVTYSVVIPEFGVREVARGGDEIGKKSSEFVIFVIVIVIVIVLL